MDGEKVREGVNEVGMGRKRISVSPCLQFQHFPLKEVRRSEGFFLCGLWLVSNCSCWACTSRMCEACDSAVTCTGSCPPLRTINIG